MSKSTTSLEDLVKSIQNDVKTSQAVEQRKAASNATKSAGGQAAQNTTYTLTTGDVASTHVFIDDSRTPGNVAAFGLPENQTWRLIKTYAEFERYLDKHGIPEFVSFDFNLNSEKTGHDCAKLLVEKCLEAGREKLPGFMYHGDLESGRIIENYLMFYGKHKRVYKAKHATGQSKNKTAAAG